MNLAVVAAITHYYHYDHYYWHCHDHEHYHDQRRWRWCADDDDAVSFRMRLRCFDGPGVLACLCHCWCLRRSPTLHPGRLIPSCSLEMATLHQANMTQTCAIRLSLLLCRRERKLLPAIDERIDRSLYPARLLWSLLLCDLPLALATTRGARVQRLI